MHDESIEAGAHAPDAGGAPPVTPGPIAVSQLAPRSSWPIVIGATGILVGVLGVLRAGCMSGALAGFDMLQRRKAAMAPAGGPDDRALIIVEYSNNALLAIMGVVLIAASIGLIGRRARACRVMAYWAIGRLVLAAVFVATSILVAAFAKSSGMGQVDAGETMLGLAIVYIPKLLLGIAFPMFVLFWLSRKRIGAEVETWT